MLQYKFYMYAVVLDITFQMLCYTKGRTDIRENHNFCSECDKNCMKICIYSSFII